MSIKSPYSDFKRQWVCGLQVTCIIDGVIGEALNGGDKIAAMTVCGQEKLSGDFKHSKGVSVMTGADGSWFRLPPINVSGTHRVCWCAGENLCVSPQDYDLDIGSLLVGGPNSGPQYLCYEWRPCVIDGLLGTFLHDGDRLRVVPNGAGCAYGGSVSITTTGGDIGNASTTAAGATTTTVTTNVSTNLPPWPIVRNFPLAGLGLPATGGGHVHSWGLDRVRAVPGVYALCWCSGALSPTGICQPDGMFNLSAGLLRIGTAKEYKFLTRVKEPEDRSSDIVYVVALAIVLPLILVLVALLGWKRISHESARKKFQDAVAVNPFAKGKGWAEKNLEKAKIQYAVKTVHTLRTLARGGMPEDQVCHALQDADITTVTAFKGVQSEHFEPIEPTSCCRGGSMTSVDLSMSITDSLPGSLSPSKASRVTVLSRAGSVRSQFALGPAPARGAVEPPGFDPDDDSWKPPCPPIAAPRMWQDKLDHTQSRSRPGAPSLREVLELPPETEEENRIWASFAGYGKTGTGSSRNLRR
jgi:hypothetical protein